MSTIKQKLAFNELLQAIESGEGLNIKMIMKKAGYKKGTLTKIKDLVESKGWKELLGQISDEIILAKFYEILISTDKRASMDAGKELLKLKDRYPASKVKTDILLEQRDKVVEDKGKEDKEEEEKEDIKEASEIR